ncbi:hypothetical protein PFISCL1PPCAC_14169 [Pristionchus fissidentatus]|uniref:Uncharacterized protein n=1 Tax=Pristionchus fissidentatus TaxID=1538716 RepID=A0AAV5VY52_9BILA|nr:hypothetical protein PFISCL1PPCAC_14169 [Pristionchus fissidentatus]
MKKTIESLKNHFQTRKSKLKKNIALQNKYISATGGGTDKELEAAKDKLDREFSRGDAIMLSMFARTPAFLGHTDESEETGFEEAQAIRSGDLDWDPFEDTDDIKRYKNGKKSSASKRTRDESLLTHSSETTRIRMENARAFAESHRAVMNARSSAHGFKARREDDEISGMDYSAPAPAKRIKKELIDSNSNKVAMDDSMGSSSSSRAYRPQVNTMISISPQQLNAIISSSVASSIEKIFKDRVGN